MQIDDARFDHAMRCLRSGGAARLALIEHFETLTPSRVERRGDVAVAAIACPRKRTALWAAQYDGGGECVRACLIAFSS